MSLSNPSLSHLEAEKEWSKIVAGNKIPFEKALRLRESIFSSWDKRTGPAPAWFPSSEILNSSNISQSSRLLGLKSEQDFYRWSITQREKYWEHVVSSVLEIPFHRPFEKILDSTQSPKHKDSWLNSSLFNVWESCFRGPPEKTAVKEIKEDGRFRELSGAQLKEKSSEISLSLRQLGFKKGSRLAIAMPMNLEAVLLYLGILKIGAVIVSIADSFSASEMESRFRISQAEAVFTQDFLWRGGKKIPLYEKIKAARSPRAIVLSAEGSDAPVSTGLRDGDLSWGDFLKNRSTETQVASCEPHEMINILFSSGTTGDPKAIPWTQSTALKCAADAYFHHNVLEDDVFAWPTNLGWMMGPWLIFATLMNKACLALFDGNPATSFFGDFIQNLGVTKLGVVPSLVKSWRLSQCMEEKDWSKIRLFSSTGECSNEEDMFYLMWLAGFKPVIEYCGGTEIGGGYLTGTVIRPAVPATFSSYAMGLEGVILDESDRVAKVGEVFLIPPSMGLSNDLLNRDHEEVYFSGTPKLPGIEVLRRHGDEVEELGNGYYRALGRVDDTMNLGGIKVSSAEIERCLSSVSALLESAAIAVPPEGGGPSLLVVFAVLKPVLRKNPPDDLHKSLRSECQQTIKTQLNPLFKLNELVVVDSLPRTASNKIMRRELRATYLSKREPVSG